MESSEEDIASEFSADDVEIEELKPWNHLELSENKVEAK